MVTNQPRQSKGTPQGGEYSATQHDESTVTLDASAGASTAVMDAMVAPEPDPSFVPDEPQTLSPGRTIIASGDPPPERHKDGDVTWVRHTIGIGGTPQFWAANLAVASRIARSEQPDVTRNKLAHIAGSNRSQASLLCVNQNGAVSVAEGRIVERDGELYIIRKGERSLMYPITTDMNSKGERVLAARQGYGHVDEMADNFNDIKSRMPQLTDVDFDSIPNEGNDDEYPPSDIAAAFVYDHPGFGDGPTHGCVFLATDKTVGDPSKPDELDVVGGYLVVSNENGLHSVQGSMYLKELKSRGGRVAGFRPGSMTFADAMTLGDRSGNPYTSDPGDIEYAWDAVAKASR